MGSKVPELSAPVKDKDYTISGLVDDTEVTVTLSCAPDMSKVGEYATTPDASEKSGNYVLTCVNGTLKVSRRPADDDATYTPSVEETENGNTTVSDKNPEKDDEVTVTDRNGDSVEVIDNGDGTYTYVQPYGKVTISVTYVCDSGALCPAAKFTDIDTSLWYHDGVHYCVASGIMECLPGNLFGPMDSTTRAQVVVMLWRLEGKPVVNYLMDFVDVGDIWYTEAVRWAASEKIVEGYGDTFGPNDNITREQLVTIMWRYAKYKGIDVNVGENTNILSYEGVVSVSDWAIPAMQWACGAGVVEGIESAEGMTLAPKTFADRATIATIFQRYCEEVVGK